jgi:hypothetical protein
MSTVPTSSTWPVRSRLSQCAKPTPVASAGWRAAMLYAAKEGCPKFSEFVRRIEGESESS